MKKILLKESFREIKKTYKKFISILLMAFLGVGFFAGIRAASPDMERSVDEYFKASNMYDIQVLSTLGLTNNDIEALKNVEKIENVHAAYSKDFLINVGEKEIVAKAHSIEENINKVNLIEGEIPQNINECVVEEGFLLHNNMKIGDSIELEGEGFKEKGLKIVGTVQSPLYISVDRGTSSLGSGKVDYYIYFLKDNFDLEAYTEIYLKVANTEKTESGSNKYKREVKEAIDEIEKIKKDRETARYDELIKEATDKVTEAEDELNTAKSKAEKEFKEAEDKIAKAKNDILDAESQIKSNKAEANKKFKDAENQLKQAEQELQKNIEQFNTGKVEADKKLQEAEELLKEQKNNLEIAKQGLETAKTNYQQVLNALQNTTGLTAEQIAGLEAQKVQLEGAITSLEGNISTLNGAINQIQTEITNGKNELSQNETKLNNAKTELEKQKSQLSKTKASTYQKIQDAEKELENGKSELENNIQKLNEEKEKYNKEIKDAETKIIDAKDEISKIEKAKWYIFDREDNTGYKNFIQDTKNIENIGKVFPIVFFVIATLISLTSMTRMVEEQVVQIGTLKAIGYTKLQIIGKYLLYSSLATIIGGIIGMCIGFYLLPKLMWSMYEVLYTLPEFILEFNIYYGTVGLGLAYICIVGATIYACFHELNKMPADLMRPKSPKMGKRVLLERVDFVWKRLTFIQKVSVRNIFRYKKRFLMTIIGIMGCTALILAGFGLKDSISKVLSNQYEKVFNYEQMVSLKEDLTNEQIDGFINEFKQKEEINDFVKVNIEAGKLKANDNVQEVQVVVPDSNIELEKVINLNNIKTKEKVNLDSETIAITYKLSQLLDVKIGDSITFENNNKEEKQFKIGNIVENYVYHYVYMSKDLWEASNEKYSTNILYLKTDKLEEQKEKDLAKEIVLDNRTSSVILTSSMKGMMDDTMRSLNYVVWVLIASSGVLAFVVLYNLSNVNISERIRELATIKVLGFYNNEVYAYINRETTLLTTIGIVVGLVAGFFLNTFIITTCETEILKFGTEIHPLSYLYAVLITIVFTIIVNIFTYLALKKINMIEALKSVE